MALSKYCKTRCKTVRHWFASDVVDWWNLRDGKHMIRCGAHRLLLTKLMTKTANISYTALRSIESAEARDVYILTRRIRILKALDISRKKAAYLRKDLWEMGWFFAISIGLAKSWFSLPVKELVNNFDYDGTIFRNSFAVVRAIVYTFRPS